MYKIHCKEKTYLIEKVALQFCEQAENKNIYADAFDGWDWGVCGHIFILTEQQCYLSCIST